MDLVPIKVKIGLRPNRHADHPDWTRLPLAQAEDPATHMFHGWKYDKTSGHAEDTPDSPLGMQWGAVLVTAQFATEALATFPAIVSVMTEAEFENFWNDKAHAHMPAERVDRDVLEGLLAERNLLIALSRPTNKVDSTISKALDPDDQTPGKRRDHLKTWALAKTRLGVTVGTLP